MRSLRFRLPAFFLAGVVVAGLVAIAIKLFQDYTRSRTYAALHREARGLSSLYAETAGLRDIRSGILDQATGDRIYFVPRGHLTIGHRLRTLPPGAIPARALRPKSEVAFEFA